MKNITSNKKQTKNPINPRVKIYYLKDNPSGSQISNEKIHMTAPSLFCLSSLIQNKKNSIALEQTGYPSFNNLNQSYKNKQFQQKQSPQFIKSKHPHLKQLNDEYKSQNRKAFTADLSLLSKRKHSNLNNLSERNPHQTLLKRLLKTSHQKHQSQNKLNPSQNKLNLSQQNTNTKDYLCNIVKEWNYYQDSPKKDIKLLKNQAITQTIHKHYTQDQQIQMKKNKFLLQQHFNLFLENQKKKKKQTKKTQSNRNLKDISHKEEKQDVDINKKRKQFWQNNLIQKKYKSQRTTPFKKLPGNGSFHIRSSASDKQKKKAYSFTTFLEGPQVVLNARFYENHKKVLNFNWSKLDQRQFDLKKK